MWPTVFEVGKKEKRKENIEKGFESGEYSPDVQKEYAQVTEEVEGIRELEQEITAHTELLDIAESEKDVEDIASAVYALEKKISEKERELRFDGPYDKNDAIITIQAGAGGTDAQDWSEMLERMYLRFAEGKGWQTSSIHRSLGEEAGIKSSTFEVRGRYAFGTLRGEAGVHRLVRQSPFNADSLRQTSFARVEMLPKLEKKQAPEIDPSDLQVDTFRASGAGGQHVNKTSSAVRIRHVPTNIVVQSQNQRSQAQNKELALSVLAAKLQLLAEEQHVERIKELRGEVKAPAWGNQIRSYVLHPYKLVKDHRTNVEIKDVESVLDGAIAPFLDT